MKKSLLVALSVTAFVLAASVSTLADDKEKTITGEGQCAKCSLKKASECQNAIVTKEDGKEVTYYMAKNKVATDFHKNICTKKVEVKAKGTVKEVDGKHELTASSIEVVTK